MAISPAHARDAMRHLLFYYQETRKGKDGFSPAQCGT
ncbi:Os01g0603566 [Oryza sativa Japonica Group]|uniref:Os01g0603566 protein n=1 Tax=Oryza sativa subsp. japonica TaxID=39947 RepID=C7IX20_ORYSJ|nr:Os01g0603566 [Oryza sativa Japonica Group]|eukprot:NP_001172454.1 Os01g0603566 [Oryza sativa Japonica Group]